MVLNGVSTLINARYLMNVTTTSIDEFVIVQSIDDVFDVHNCIETLVGAQTNRLKIAAGGLFAVGAVSSSCTPVISNRCRELMQCVFHIYSRILT